MVTYAIVALCLCVVVVVLASSATENLDSLLSDNGNESLAKPKMLHCKVVYLQYTHIYVYVTFWYPCFVLMQLDLSWKLLGTIGGTVSRHKDRLSK